MKINSNSMNYPSVPGAGQGLKRNRAGVDPALRTDRVNKSASNEAKLRGDSKQQFYVPEANFTPGINPEKKPVDGNVQRLNLNHQALKSYQEHQQMDEAQELNLAQHALLGVDTYA